MPRDGGKWGKDRGRGNTWEIFVVAVVLFYAHG